MSQAALMASMFAGQGIMQLGQSYSESRAIKSQAAYTAQQAEFNSKLAELQAKQAEAKGYEESNLYKTNIKKLIGSQRAALAAQGIEVGSGSALALQDETAELGALDALTIRNNAFREAAGYRIQSIDYQTQARMAKIQGKYGARNTLISGGLSALSSFAQAGYYGSKMPGKPAPGGTTTYNGRTVSYGTTPKGYSGSKAYFPK